MKNKKTIAETIYSVLVSNDKLSKSDAIILLEGDYYNRVDETVSLFKKGLGKYIVVSGGVDDPKAGKIPALLLKKKLVGKKIPEGKIILEEKSQNTREQALEVMKVVEARKWKKIILVASHFHIFRAHLTFIKAMQENGLKLGIYSAPVRDLTWFKRDGQSRGIDLLREEYAKIEKYGTHVASFEDGIKYLEWREGNI